MSFHYPTKAAAGPQLARFTDQIRQAFVEHRKSMLSAAVPDCWQVIGLHAKYKQEACDYLNRARSCEAEGDLDRGTHLRGRSDAWFSAAILVEIAFMGRQLTGYEGRA